MCIRDSGRRKVNLTWKMDYEWEIWNRKFRDVNRNNDHSIRGRLDFGFNLSGGTSSGATKPAGPRPLTTLLLKADYRYSNRRALVYNTQPLTFCPSNSVPPDTTCPVALGGAPAS